MNPDIEAFRKGEADYRAGVKRNPYLNDDGPMRLYAAHGHAIRVYAARWESGWRKAQRAATVANILNKKRK